MDYSLSEASEKTGIPAPTLKKWVTEGKIQAFKAAKGKRQIWRITESALRQVISPTEPYESHIATWKQAMASGYGYKKPLLPRSVETNLYAMNYFWRWLACEPDITKLTPEKLELAFSRVPYDGDSCHYTQRIQVYNAVRSLVRHLNKKLGLGIDLDDFKPYRPRRVVDVERKKITKHEFYEMLRIHDTRRKGKSEYQRVQQKVLFALTGLSGLRKAECVSLKISQVYLERGYLHVLGKGKKYRKAPMPKDMRALMKLWLENYHGGGVLVLEGMTESAAEQAMKRLAEASKLDVSLHGLRRTAATWWHKEGMPLATVKAALGHSEIETTMGYIEAEADDAVDFFK